MSLIVYKTSQYKNWKAVSGTFTGGGSSTTDFSLLLSNYYTKIELQTSGSASVHFDNITDAYHNHLLGLEGGSIGDSTESSGTAGEYYHLDYYNYDRLMFLNFSESLVEDVNNVVTLVNDASSPGIYKYYGTDGTGVKGWYGLPDSDSSGGVYYSFSGSLIEDSIGVITLVNDEASPGNSMYYGTDVSGIKGFHALPTGGGTVDSGDFVPIDDQYWQEDSIGDLSPISVGVDVYAHDFVLIP